MLDTQYLPLLLALSVESVLPSLTLYLRELEKRHHIKSIPAPIPTALVARATTSTQSLTQHDANVLTDICHSIRGLEEATRTSEGKTKLVDYMGPTIAQTLVDFWGDEWIADQ